MSFQLTRRSQKAVNKWPEALMFDTAVIQRMDDNWLAIEGTGRLLRTDSGVLARINKQGKITALTWAGTVNNILGDYGGQLVSF